MNVGTLITLGSRATAMGAEVTAVSEDIYTGEMLVVLRTRHLHPWNRDEKIFRIWSHTLVHGFYNANSGDDTAPPLVDYATAMREFGGECGAS